MDPPVSPVKPPFSRDMPVFPASPVRVGTPPRSPRYGGDPPAMSPSPSAPNLRSQSPLRQSLSQHQPSPKHSRAQSDVSVSGLAVMFEGLEVKDPKEAARRYKEALAREKAKSAKVVAECTMRLERKDIHMESLRKDLETAKASLEVGVTKSNYEREYKSNREKVANLTQRLTEMEDQYRCTHINLVCQCNCYSAIKYSLLCRIAQRGIVKFLKKNTSSTRGKRWNSRRII